MEEIKMKVCSKCGRELPKNTDYFFKRKANKDGLEGICKECRSGTPFSDKLRYSTKQGYRICYSCNVEYELNSDNFYKSKLSKDGLRTTCKNCDNKNSKIYRQNNKEKTAKQWQNWYTANKNYKNEYDKRYRKANTETIKKYNTEYQKQYRKTTKGRAIRKMHYHIREAKIRNLEYDFTEEDWFNCKQYFDYKCAYCGKEVDNLTRDHFIALNNGGAYIKENIIPCCFSCNCSKQDKNFYEWYIGKEFYNKDRINKIEKYLDI